MRLFFSLVLVSTALIVFQGCQSNGKKSKTTETLEIDSKAAESEKSVMYFAAPAPEEILAFFDDEFLFKNVDAVNSVDKLADYNSVYEQGLNLGVYMADAGYLNFNSSPGKILPYMDAIFQLSDKLQVSSMIDKNTMVNAMDDRDNMDSVIYYANQINQSITDYLIDNGQEDLLCLMSVGSLVEILYLVSSNLEYVDEHVALIQQIADQKILFDNIYEVCEANKQDAKVAKSMELLGPLKTIIDGFGVESNKTALEHDKDHLIIKGGDKVSISKEQYANFKTEVNKVRTTIVK